MAMLVLRRVALPFSLSTKVCQSVAIDWAPQLNFSGVLDAQQLLPTRCLYSDCKVLLMEEIRLTTRDV